MKVKPSPAPSTLLYGFHAVGVRLKVAPRSIVELYVDADRRDARMRQLCSRADALGVPLQVVDAARLAGLCGGTSHQGVVARVVPLGREHSLEDWLDRRDSSPTSGVAPDPLLLLVLDGVTDPHNVGACLRVADGAGAHAVIAPKDHACGLTPVVAKVSSGASESVPYFLVTNLACTLRDLQDRDVTLVGLGSTAARVLYAADLTRPVALVLGAEGKGLRRLTQECCDELVSIPMLGAVESLNVSVASGVCLYEARRQRTS
ncbi:RNA methyltransferase [Candidatus Symbiobacter mobilis CR]|uniref:23S rRNA (guanosine-2'-O-)-methyltransferase RlmB n=1 Tax=Candidatus Symbiobacter mobilis CR TaxID=946483 RepID=U5N8Q0_9BURK|nr:RNA methyltransferase [Candidatus Symbiobacter mobilis CR]